MFTLALKKKKWNKKYSRIEKNYWFVKRGSGFRFWPGLSVLVVFERRGLKNSSDIGNGIVRRGISVVFKTIVDRFFSIVELKRRKGGVSRFDLAFSALYYELWSISTCQLHYKLIAVSFVLSRSTPPPLDNRIALNNVANFLFVSCFCAIQFCDESLCQVQVVIVNTWKKPVK